MRGMRWHSLEFNIPHAPETVRCLEEHANDGHHCESPVGKLSGP